MHKLFLFLIAFNSHTLPTPKPPDLKQLMCLTTAVYSEARGEPIIGKDAVAHVILNRERQPERIFGSSICEVTHQKGQFPDLKSHNIKVDYEGKEWQDSVSTATFAYYNMTEDITQGSLWYYAHHIVHPKWAHDKDKLVVGQIYNHTFIKVRPQPVQQITPALVIAMN